VSNYLYVNYANTKAGYITKIGISNNPEKRLNEFNLGVRYRTSFKNSPQFQRFFTVKIADRDCIKKLERIILLKYKSNLLPFYGREVFHIHPEKVSLHINDIVGAQL